MPSLVWPWVQTESELSTAALRCAVLCCAVLCCAVLCCAEGRCFADELH